MNVMLGVIFASVVIGLTANRFGRRQHLLLICLAVGMSLLYIVSPERFM